MKRFGLIIGFILFALSTKAQYNDDFYLCFDTSRYKYYSPYRTYSYIKERRHHKEYLRKFINDICEICGYFEYRYEIEPKTNIYVVRNHQKERLEAWILAAEIYCTAYCDPVSAGGNYEKEYLDAIQRCKQLCTKELDDIGRYAKKIEEIENIGMYKQGLKLYKAGNCVEAAKYAEKALPYYRGKGDAVKVLELERIIEDCGSNSQGELSSGNENIKRGDKRYNGEFSISGIGFSNSGTQKGNAQYDYKDAPNGTRIFEGKFLYTYSLKTASCSYSDIVKGNYLNNRQIGTWKWISKSTEPRSIDPDKVEKEEVTINFNNNGKVDGTFEYSYGFYGERNGKTEYTSARKDVSGVFENGRLRRLHYWSIKDRVIAEGNYSTIDAGTPVGKWKVAGEKVPNGSVTIEFDNRGNIISAVYVDPTTGDKYRAPEWICRYPLSVYNKAVSLIRGYCYRDTEKPN